MKIECPIKGGRAEECGWNARVGQVRDFPSIGVIQCQTCYLVTHAQDLSGDVNYEAGSMHVWAQGYGDSLPGPATDIARRVTSINSLATTNKKFSILDFGCGSGGMLSALSINYEVCGVEPDIYARETATSCGHKLFESAENAISNNVKVDVVTLFHVIEHFYNASYELEKIYDLLNPGGLIIVETPNSMDALLSKYQSLEFANFTYWSHHPMLHSHKSLEHLIERCGFKIIENSGVQRYDLNNHLYWMSSGHPGGHEIWKDFAPLVLVNEYAELLVSENISDTLWVVAQKINT